MFLKLSNWASRRVRAGHPAKKRPRTFTARNPRIFSSKPEHSEGRDGIQVIFRFTAARYLIRRISLAGGISVFEEGETAEVFSMERLPGQIRSAADNNVCVWSELLWRFYHRTTSVEDFITASEVSSSGGNIRYRTRSIRLHSCMNEFNSDSEGLHLLDLVESLLEGVFPASLDTLLQVELIDVLEKRSKSQYRALRCCPGWIES